MQRQARIIGTPMDYGSNRRGVDMGPSAIRYADLAAALESADTACKDTGDIQIPRAEERDPETADIDGEAKFLDEVREVSIQLADEVATTIDAGSLPIVLGGDHSLAIGTLSGASRDSEIGAIWFDAHGDFNTPETTPSGNVHGMPLAAALGRGQFEDMDWAVAPQLREENVVWVGLREVDDREAQMIEESDATAFTMSDIDARGIHAVVDDALDLATHGVNGIHVSIDMDWLDPQIAPGVGTPARGGVTYREAHSALEAVAERDAEAGIMRSLELVEVNPILDEYNETAEMAVELAASVLGKRIL